MVWFFLSPGLNHVKWVMISDCLMLHDVTCVKAPIARISSKTLRHFSTSLNRLTCHLAGCGLESKTPWYRNLGIWSDCGSEWASGFRILEERCEVMDWMGWLNVQWLVRRLNKSISFSNLKYQNIQTCSYSKGWKNASRFGGTEVEVMLQSIASFQRFVVPLWLMPGHFEVHAALVLEHSLSSANRMSMCWWPVVVFVWTWF